MVTCSILYKCFDFDVDTNCFGLTCFIFQQMKELSKKKNLNSKETEMMQKLMTLTFHDRRQDIVVKNKTIKEVLELYPVLLKPKEVSVCVLLPMNIINKHLTCLMPSYGLLSARRPFELL